MLNQEWIEMFRVIPEDHHNQVVLVLQNGSELSIDTLFRFEPHFLVARGRVAGTLDENRAFFVPYNQMLYYRIERTMKLEELQQIFDARGGPTDATSPEANGTPATIPIAVAPVPGPPVPADSTATRNALLERIRAARATGPPTAPQQASR